MSDEMEIWTAERLVAKCEYEGGWFGFYEWGGLMQRTGDPRVDANLHNLKLYFDQAAKVVDSLNEQLPSTEEW